MTGARIDYVELPSATAHELTRAFYSKAFGWKFADYGPTYSATTNGVTDVGLQGDPEGALAAPLPVVKVEDLESAFDAVSKGIDDKVDTVIVDTAGRLQIDEELMEELARVRDEAKPTRLRRSSAGA